MEQTPEAATAAVQAFWARVPGSAPQAWSARPFEDGHLVREADRTALSTSGLFLVRREQVRFVGSGEIPYSHRIWAELVAEQG